MPGPGSSGRAALIRATCTWSPGAWSVARVLQLVHQVAVFVFACPGRPCLCAWSQTPGAHLVDDLVHLVDLVERSGPWSVVRGQVAADLVARAMGHAAWHGSKYPLTRGPKNGPGRWLRGLRPDFTRYVPRETVLTPGEGKTAPFVNSCNLCQNFCNSKTKRPL